MLLNAAKAFPSTLHAAIFEILTHAGYPDNYVAAIKKVYQHTDTCCVNDIKGQHIHCRPTTGVKEGSPCSALLFSIVYELLLKQLVIKHPNASVYVDDITIIVKSQDTYVRRSVRVGVLDRDVVQSGKD